MEEVGEMVEELGEEVVEESAELGKQMATMAWLQWEAWTGLSDGEMRMNIGCRSLDGS